jgi:hypothetical protein
MDSNGKVDIIDICIKCNKMTDNDTGKEFEKGQMDANPSFNSWICGNCRENNNKLDKCRQELTNVILDSEAIVDRMLEIEEKVDEVNGINTMLLETAKQILEETK